MYHKIVNSPKFTMVTLANASTKPNAMMIKLEDTFITVMAMLSSWRLHMRQKSSKFALMAKSQVLSFNNPNEMAIYPTLMTKKPASMEKAARTESALQIGRLPHSYLLARNYDFSKNYPISTKNKLWCRHFFFWGKGEGWFNIWSCGVDLGEKNSRECFSVLPRIWTDNSLRNSSGMKTEFLNTIV